MSPEEKERFQKECNGCPALDDQLERVRTTEGHLVDARNKLKTVKAIADSLVEEPRVKQIGEQLHRALAGELPAGRVGGVDLAAAPSWATTQSWLTFSCPAGCKHRVQLPDYPGPAETCLAIKEQTGLDAWETVGGAVMWERHEVLVASGIEVADPVRTLEEYSSDIDDPLRAAHDELDCAILGVDSEKAWSLTENQDRDLWISSVEMFMAAMLKWAQQEERRRHHAAGVMLREHNDIRRGDPLAAVLEVITGIDRPKTKETEMKEKTLHNSDVNGTRKNVADLVVYGNVDSFKLLCKASSQEEGWMKSTKVMEVGGYREDGDVIHGPIGCLVQVTTQQRNADGSYAVAEALTFVPGASFASFDFPADSE